MSAKRIESLRLIWLEAYLATVDHGSYYAAAKALGCHQSSVSRSVAQLESWLGRTLVEFDVPVKITPDGEKFAATARHVVSALNDSRTPVVLQKA